MPLPNLIVAGAPKSGTSSLHLWLSDHPEASGSSPKETFYFVDPGTHMHDPKVHISMGLDGYGRFFTPGEEHKVTLEATPSYLYSETALRHLPDLPTEPRFLFVLREPASQIYSLYTYFQNNWSWVPAEMSFPQFVEAARQGSHGFGGNELAANALGYADYEPFLARWRERVGKERMRVALFDELKADPKRFMQETAEWLGIEPAFYDTYGFPRDNETYVVKSPRLQRLNIALRAALPKGVAYDRLRAIYRRVNTAKPQGPSQDEAEAIGELRRSFETANARLAAAFDLDLSPWRAGAAPRG